MTAYELRISDWSSDVCSSDLVLDFAVDGARDFGPERASGANIYESVVKHLGNLRKNGQKVVLASYSIGARERLSRSEEHTTELQSPMPNSYAVFCLKKKTDNQILYIQAPSSFTRTLNNR